MNYFDTIFFKKKLLLQMDESLIHDMKHFMKLQLTDLCQHLGCIDDLPSEEALESV